MDIVDTPDMHIVDGKPYRRVTSLLKEYGLIPAYYANGNAMEFGTNVHECARLYNNGHLDPHSVDPALRPYFNQYIRFWEDHDMDILTHNETLFASKVYGFAGRVDNIWNGTDIYDIKTGARADWHSVQLAMYKILAKENGVKIKNCYALYLTDHDYKPQAYNERKYMAIALAILTIKNYKKS